MDFLRQRKSGGSGRMSFRCGSWKRQGTLVLSMEDRQVIEEGAPLFSDRVRVADDLDRLEAGQQELAALSIGNRAVMPEEETEQLEKYTRIFHFRLPDDAEISEKQQDCRRIAELRAVREERQAQKNEKKRPGSAKIAILALGALLLLAGIGCLVAEKLSLGIAAVVLGALSLARGASLEEAFASGRRCG